MENGGERRTMEKGVRLIRVFSLEFVMCSTCSGFVMRKGRIPDPDEEVVEVAREAKKMRDLMQAVLLHGPFQEKEPAEATKKQWQVLRRRKMIMMETKRCPACSRSLSEKPGPDEEDKAPGSKEKKTAKPGPDEEDKAPGSKEKKRSSREEGIELMAVLPSQGVKDRKKIATEDAMVANARSVKKTKRSREEGKRSSSGLKKKKAKSEDKEGKTSSSGLKKKKKKKKKKAKSEYKEGSGSKIKAKRSSETEGIESKEAELEGSGSKEVEMEVSKSASGNGKTKMVTRRFDKMSIGILLRDLPPIKPYTCTTCDPFLECLFASDIARYEVDCEFHEYLRRQYIKGYAEYQVEVTDDEDE